MKEWRYPEPREGEAQRQDPDDNTADGADAIAALRYLVMSWLKAPKYEKPEEELDPNYDYFFHRLMKRLEREQNRRRKGRRPLPNMAVPKRESLRRGRRR